MDAKEKEAMFMAELEGLFRRFGFIVTSCGCCDGCWVQPASDDDIKESISEIQNNECTRWK